MLPAISASLSTGSMKQVGVFTLEATSKLEKVANMVPFGPISVSGGMVADTSGRLLAVQYVIELKRDGGLFPFLTIDEVVQW